MDTHKRIRNSTANISFEDENDHNLQLELNEPIETASSLNFADASSFSLCSSSSSNEPPYDFSELLAQPPVKKGLSKYYKGKSRTFTSLSDVKCVEDLSKGETYHKKRAHKPLHGPKANISKKDGRSCFTSLLSKWS